jgi:hypothetical protein
MTRNVIDENVVGGPSTGSSLFSDLRVGARIARRSLRKHWVANLIIVLLIALPVAGMGAISTLTRTKLSGERYQAQRGELRKGYELDQWGDADFRLQSTGASMASSQASEWANLPRGSLVEPESYLLCGRLRVAPKNTSKSNPKTQRVSAQLYSSNLGSPVFRGRRTLSAGGWAKQGNDIVVSTRLAKALNLSPGAMVTGCGNNYLVTGILESPPGTRYANEAFVFPPDSNGDSFYVKLPKRIDASQPLIGLDGTPFAIPDRTRALPASQPLPPVTFVTPAMLSHTSDQGIENNLWIVRALGAMALVVLGALAAAVFTVSAQRQRQSAGLLSLTGASTRAVHFTMLLQGTWCGVLASVVGSVIGVVGIRLMIPYRNEVFSTVLDSYVIAPGDWLWAMVIAIVATTLAALRPARGVARSNLLRAERERTTPPAFTSTGGKFILAIGAAAGFGILTTGSSSNRVNLAPRSWAIPFALLAVMASVTAVWIGTPLLLSALTSLSSRFSLLLLSVRSLTRNLHRSAATISGVGVVFGVLVAVMLATSNASAYSADRYGFLSGVSLHRSSAIPCAVLNGSASGQLPSPPLPLPAPLPISPIPMPPQVLKPPTPPAIVSVPSIVASGPLPTLSLTAQPLATVALSSVPLSPLLLTTLPLATVPPAAQPVATVALSTFPNTVLPIVPSADLVSVDSQTIATDTPSTPVMPAPVVPVLQDSVAPWDLCVTKGLSDAEVREAHRIIGRPSVEIRRYQVNSNDAPSVTVANPALIRALGLSSEEQSILEREGIIDYSRNGADVHVYRGSDGQLHNVGSLATPGLPDLVREDVIRSASFTQVKTQRLIPFPVVYLVTEKALLDPAQLAEKSIAVSVSYVPLDKPLTGPQRDDLQELVDQHLGQRSTSNSTPRWSQLISFPPPDSRDTMALVRLMASFIAGAIALLSIALSLALSSVETRKDHQRLVAIGASPNTIRRLRTQTSALLAFGGCVIATIVALPVFRMVLWAGDDRSDHVRHPIPFTALAITITAVTAAAALLGAAFQPRK